MASTIKQAPQGVWTQITTTDKAGEVFHLSGDSQVVYTESVLQPVGYDANTPVSNTSVKRENFTYYSIAATNFLWAYSISGASSLTVTPEGV